MDLLTIHEEVMSKMRMNEFNESCRLRARTVCRPPHESPYICARNVGMVGPAAVVF